MRLRWRLRSLMVLVALLALSLALIAQYHRLRMAMIRAERDRAVAAQQRAIAQARSRRGAAFLANGLSQPTATKPTGQTGPPPP